MIRRQLSLESVATPPASNLASVPGFQWFVEDSPCPDPSGPSGFLRIHRRFISKSAWNLGDLKDTLQLARLSTGPLNYVSKRAGFSWLNNWYSLTIMSLMSLNDVSLCRGNQLVFNTSIALLQSNQSPSSGNFPCSLLVVIHYEPSYPPFETSKLRVSWLWFPCVWFLTVIVRYQPSSLIILLIMVDIENECEWSIKWFISTANIFHEYGIVQKW